MWHRRERINELREEKEREKKVELEPKCKYLWENIIQNAFSSHTLVAHGARDCFSF